VTDEDLAEFGWEGPDSALIAAGAVAAAEAAAPTVDLDGLAGRSVAMVGSGPVVESAEAAAGGMDVTLGEPRFDTEADVLFVAGKAGCLDHDTAETVQARLIVPLTGVPVTARALAVLGRSNRVVVPDFLSTAASLLATHDPAGGDPDGRIADAVERLVDSGAGMWLAAALRAEDYLARWTEEKPFGRPLA
jgi:glutamate dehydrogenase/leucine dehydrogenase